METRVQVEEEEDVEEDIEYHTEKSWNIYCILLTIIAVLIILIFAFGPVDTPHPKDTLDDKDNKVPPVPQGDHPVFVLSILLLPLLCLLLLAAISFGWILGPHVEEKFEVELDNNNTYAVKRTDDTVDNGSKSRLKIFNCISFLVIAISVTMIYAFGPTDTPQPKDTLSAKDKDNKVPQWDGSSVFTLSILLLLITYAVAVCVNYLAWLFLGWEAKTVENDDKNNTCIDKSGRQRDDTGQKIRLKIFNYIFGIIFGVLIFVSCTDPLHLNERSDADKKSAGYIYGIVVTVISITFAVANINPGMWGEGNKDVSTWDRSYFVSEHLLEADEAKKKNLVLHKYLSKEKVYIYYDHNYRVNLV